MTRSVVIFLVLSALLASTGLADIHWILHPSVHTADGPSSAYATSILGSREITYVPPVHWLVSGTRFLPPGKTEADASVDAIPIKEPLPWTPDRIKETHAMVLSQAIPGGASKPAIVSEGMLPIQIDGQSVYEICVSYAFYGREYMESVDFLERGTLQLRFKFGCLKDDFTPLHAAFIASLLTLQGF